MKEHTSPLAVSDRSRNPRLLRRSSTLPNRRSAGVGWSGWLVGSRRRAGDPHGGRNGGRKCVTGGPSCLLALGFLLGLALFQIGRASRTRVRRGSLRYAGRQTALGESWRDLLQKTKR